MVLSKRSLSTYCVFYRVVLERNVRASMYFCFGCGSYDCLPQVPIGAVRGPSDFSASQLKIQTAPVYPVDQWNYCRISVQWMASCNICPDFIPRYSWPGGYRDWFPLFYCSAWIKFTCRNCLCSCFEPYIYNGLRFVPVFVCYVLWPPVYLGFIETCFGVDLSIGTNFNRVTVPRISVVWSTLGSTNLGTSNSVFVNLRQLSESSISPQHAMLSSVIVAFPWVFGTTGVLASTYLEIPPEGTLGVSPANLSTDPLGGTWLPVPLDAGQPAIRNTPLSRRLSPPIGSSYAVAASCYYQRV